MLHYPSSDTYSSGHPLIPSLNNGQQPNTAFIHQKDEKYQKSEPLSINKNTSSISPYSQIKRYQSPNSTLSFHSEINSNDFHLEINQNYYLLWQMQHLDANSILRKNKSQPSIQKYDQTPSQNSSMNEQAQKIIRKQQTFNNGLANTRTLSENFENESNCNIVQNLSENQNNGGLQMQSLNILSERAEMLSTSRQEESIEEELIQNQIIEECLRKRLEQQDEKLMQKSNQISVKKQVLNNKSDILRGIYYNNRASFLNWLKEECMKMKLSRETFANAVFLMDEYYKKEKYNGQQFVLFGISAMIISSKVIQYGVLSTRIMAQNNDIDVSSLCVMELKVLRWFKFKINTYNYAFLMNNCIHRWNIEAQKHNIINLMAENIQSFLLYQKIFFLADNLVKFHKALPHQAIQCIFLHVFAKLIAEDILQQIIENIFSNRNFSYKINFPEQLVSYDYMHPNDPHYLAFYAEIRQNIKIWSKEIQVKEELFRKYFQDHQEQNKLYSDLLSLQF